MKIAFFHELHDGGARRTVNEFAKRLKKNHTVDLYIVDDAENHIEKSFFTHVFFYPFFAKKWHGGNWRVRLYKDTIELYALYILHKKVATDINNKTYDFVFIHPSQYTQAPFILRFLKTKITYYCPEPLRMVYEDTFVIPNMGIIKKLYEYTIRYIRKNIDKTNISYADTLLTNSTHTKNTIKKAYGMQNEVCYLGVDENIFSPKDEKKYDILFIGSQEKIDGYTLLEKAVGLMKKKPTIKTHLSGKDWIANDKEFAKLYQQSKVVVCLATNEPFGLIPLEAMACAVPVIALEEGGYKETVVNTVTGYLIPRDPHVLAEKLIYLLKNDTIRKNMGKNGRKIVLRKWTWDSSTKRLEVFLKQ